MLGLGLGLGFSRQRPSLGLLRFFPGGQDGVLLDFSDTSTVFLDAGGVSPASPTGDLARLLTDKSGNSNDTLAPLDANRGTYQSGSGAFWIGADGVDDYYTADTRFGLGANPGLTVIAAINTGPQASAIERVWHLGDATMGSISGAVGSSGVSWRHNNGNRIFPLIANDTDAVVAWRRSAGDTYGDGEVFVDGVAQVQSSVTSPGTSPTDTGAKLALFAQPNATEAFGGRIYAIMAVPYRMTDADLDSATSLLSGKLQDAAPEGGPLLAEDGSPLLAENSEPLLEEA